MPRTSSKNRATTRKTTTTKRTTTAEPKNTSLYREVKCLGLAAGGILLFVGVFFPDAAGFVGRFIHNFSLGLFGFGAYLLPIALIAAAIGGLVSKDLRIPFIQIIALFWFLLAMLHIINPPQLENLSAFEAIRAVYLEGRTFGGGIFGMLLGDMLSFVLGNAGSIILLAAASLILLILITGRSFIKLIQSSASRAKDYYDERAAAYEVYQAERAALSESEVKLTGKPPARSRFGLKPLPEKAVTKKPEFVHIEGDHADTATRIKLVQEDLEDRAEKPVNPLFTKRSEYGAAGKRAKIITFPVVDPNETTAAFAPVIHDSVSRASVKTSASAKHEPDELDEALESWDGGIRSFDASYDDADDGVYASSAHVSDASIDVPETTDGLSAEAYFSSDGPVVKGLVDDVKETSELDTLFPLDDVDDDLMYDEYAHASGLSRTASGDVKPKLVIDEPEDVPDYSDFKLPSIHMLAVNEKAHVSPESRSQVLENSRILEESLRSFKVEAKVMEVSVGPSVTRYELAPGPGVKVSSISNLSNDLALSLAAHGIRIEAPIPGKSAVGIEIPNKDPQAVFLREILEDDKFEKMSSKLAFGVGKDISGAPVVADIARMPHLLIAGATGSGKSVCINTLIASILFKAKPDEVKLLMIDPKVVELSVYNGIPHLMIPVVTDPKKASGALKQAVAEMELRYNLFADVGCRDLKGFNRIKQENGEHPIPQIVIIIDELADLMMMCRGEVEDSICRLAQKARACGIHLIVATQRPSVDVITGLIKANIPSRLAFAVSSGHDSRTVLDMYGAEKLLGKGDMLFLPMGQSKPVRVQGGWISDQEVEALVTFLKAQAIVEHSEEEIVKWTMPGKTVSGDLEGVDEFFHDAVQFLIAKGKASTSMLQRQFRIGYNRASRLMEDLESRGLVGPEDGVKPRKVTITLEEYRELYGDA